MRFCLIDRVERERRKRGGWTDVKITDEEDNSDDEYSDEDDTNDYYEGTRDKTVVARRRGEEGNDLLFSSSRSPRVHDELTDSL